MFLDKRNRYVYLKVVKSYFEMQYKIIEFHHTFAYIILCIHIFIFFQMIFQNFLSREYYTCFVQNVALLISIVDQTCLSHDYFRNDGMLDALTNTSGFPSTSEKLRNDSIPSLCT